MARSLALVVSAVAFAASAQHGGDIVLGIDAQNRIITGIEDGAGVEFPQRVFSGAFGELPNFTNDPGYDTLPGTFTSGTTLTFTIRKALRAWDGQDFDAIAAERLSINFGPLGPTLSPVDDTPVTGFGVSVISGGAFHNHYGNTLQSPASPGIYLLELEMAGNRGLLTSEPYWIVFEQPGSAFDVGAAVDWVIRTYIDPACPADLSGSTDPNDAAYGVSDGDVDATDFFYFLDQFVAGNLAVADLSGSSDPNDPAYGVPDGATDSSDFFYFLDLFVAGCP